MDPTLPAGYRLVFRAGTGSTNDDARRLAGGGAADRTVVWALRQSEGRGRRGRTWVSETGNLYCSFLLRPRADLALWPQISFVAALAVSDAIGAWVRGRGALSCKWPNDVLWDGKKVSGILLESENGGALVVGIGINLAQAPRGTAFPATHLDAVVPPGEALTGLVTSFDRWRRLWEQDGFAAIRDHWLARAHGIGGTITARLQNETIKGTFQGLDGAGNLIIDVAGRSRKIAAGDVYFE